MDIILNENNKKEEFFVVKTVLKQDVRRFRFSKHASFNQLCTILANIYHVSSFMIKYVDDEDDEISVTSDQELTEALRLHSSFNSTNGTVVRFQIFETLQGGVQFTPEDFDGISTPTPASSSSIPSIPKEIDEPLESSTYPPLDPSEWDPVKKDTQDVPLPVDNKKEILLEAKENDNDIPKVTKLVRVPLPDSPDDSSSVQTTPKIKISAQCNLLSNKIKAECIAESDNTWKSCQESSKQIRDSCLEYSKQTLAETSKFSRDLNFNAEENDTSAVMMSLSDEIAKQCKDLSADTCKALGLISNGFNSADWYALSSTTATNSKALCEATCKDTLDICRQISQDNSSKYVPVDTQRLRTDCNDLSSQILNNCNVLSNQITAECLQSSSDIVKLILEL